MQENKIKPIIIVSNRDGLEVAVQKELGEIIETLQFKNEAAQNMKEGNFWIGDIILILLFVYIFYSLNKKSKS